MNVSAIHSCYAPSAVRCWSRAADRLPDGVGVDVRTGSDTGRDAYTPSNIASPLVPPWRVLPWPRTSAVAHRHVVPVAAVKVTSGSADVNAVGRTLDLFV